MNLSDILGGVTDIARTYYTIRGLRDPQPIMDRFPGPFPTTGPARRPIYTTPVRTLPGPYRGGQMSRMGRRNRMLEGLGGGAVGGGIIEGVEEFFFGEDEMDTMGCKPSDIVYQWDECAQDYVPKKKRKRRRKQLVTKGDIKGLAALKGVVGTGKIMETWIATHG